MNEGALVNKAAVVIMLLAQLVLAASSVQQSHTSSYNVICDSCYGANSSASVVMIR